MVSLKPEMQSGTSLLLSVPHSLLLTPWVFRHGGDTLTAVDFLVFSKVKNKFHMLSRRHSSQHSDSD